MVKNEAFMEFIGTGTRTMGGADTFTNVEIPTPVSRIDNIAMLIHKIEFELISALDSPAIQDGWTMQCTKNVQTAILPLGNAELLGKVRKEISMVTSGGLGEVNQVAEINFSPPILYSKSSVSFGCITSGQSAAKNFAGRIGYTLEKVKQDDFISALVD